MQGAQPPEQAGKGVQAAGRDRGRLHTLLHALLRHLLARRAVQGLRAHLLPHARRLARLPQLHHQPLSLRPLYLLHADHKKADPQRRTAAATAQPEESRPPLFHVLLRGQDTQ